MARIILDTGAACNVVKLSHVRNFKEANAGTYLRSADNYRIPVLGMAQVKIKLSNRDFVISARVVRHLSSDVVLGMTFLIRHDILLDPKNRKIIFRENSEELNAEFFALADRELPLCQPEKRKNNMKLQAKTEIVIPPGETKKVFIRSLRPFRFYHKIFPNFKFLDQRRLEICSQPKIKNRNGFFLIRSHNCEPIKIMTNTTLAYFYCKSKKDINLCNNISQTKRLTFNKEEFKINKELSLQEQENVQDLIKQFKDIFAFDMSQLGRTNLVKYDLELIDENKIVRKRPYRVSAKEQEIINKQVDNLLQYDIIEETNSPFASPVVLVKKKGGDEFRLAIDYRALNSITKPQAIHPLPNIDECLTKLYGSKYFSTLDCNSAYYQVPLTERAQERTAFVTAEGNYQFKVLPFGLTYAPSVWSLLVKKIFYKMKNKSMFAYLDDLIIFSKDYQSHLETLREIFECLRKANITLKPSKCQFLNTEIDLLGYKINQEGIQTNPNLIAAITNFPKPTKVKELQRFLGLCNFYRKFVENFSKLARPLYDLLRKDTPYHWNSQHQETFELLKNKLVTTPVLAHFSPTASTNLHVDASKEGLGAVLLQKQADNKFHPVYYISRSLTKAEKNYDVLNLEATCLVWALRTLRTFVYGRPVTVYTDNRSLCFLRTIKNPMGRIARYLLTLSEFDTDIKHKLGKLNVDCDCLSRAPVDALPNSNEDDDLPLLILNEPNLSELQEEDTYNANLKLALMNRNNTLSAAINRQAKNYKIIEDVLYKKNPSGRGFPNLLVVPQSLRNQVLYQFHDDPLQGAHLGFTKTFHKIKDRFFWFGMLKDIKNYVRSCTACQLRKDTTNKKAPGLLNPIKVGLPFDKMSVDLLGPLHRSAQGKNFIIVVSDFATRYVEAGALRDAKANTVAKFIFTNIICRHGCPREILSDRGTVFRSDLLTELLKILGSKQIFTTAYHPACNGLTERFNRTLVDALSLYVSSNQSDWDTYLPCVLFAYNTAKQESTGFNPFLLVYGREARLPADCSLSLEINNADVITYRDKIISIRNLAIQNLERSQANSKRWFDNRHCEAVYAPGDLVKIYTPSRKVGLTSKLLIKWHGPYTILKKHTDVDYVVKLGSRADSKTDVIHVSRIRPFRSSWPDN